MEICSGTGQEGFNPTENPGMVRDITIAYNISVNSKWLYLLQTANTHLDNVIFEHNTIVHEQSNYDLWTSDRFAHERSNHDKIGLFYHYDVTWGVDVGNTVEPDQLIVRNNLFVDPYAEAGGGIGDTGVFNGSGFTHHNNMFVPSSMPLGEFDLGPTDFFAEEAGLTADYRLTAASEAVDAGGSESNFAEDIDGNSVPCGEAPDIGASEYCENAGGTGGTGGSQSGGAGGGAGSPLGGTGGEVATGGIGNAANTGGVSDPGNTGGSGNAAMGGYWSGGTTATSTGAATGSGTTLTGGTLGATGDSEGADLDEGADQPGGCACTSAGSMNGSRFSALTLLALAMAAFGSRRARRAGVA
jgi:MYXO-CTERM domain-containing protein